MTNSIELNDLSKLYQIKSDYDATLRGSIGKWFSKTNSKEEFWALKGISCVITEGESVGIIGSNGSGKSTLLKILSKITYPTSGYVTLNGRVSSLLEVGTGFHHELTGRENIYLNGALLGMRKREIDLLFEEIVDFSGVEKFIDTPVKHYSSGMYVRLAFSVAAHLKSEILLVDEVLAVGDRDFQAKCIAKLKSTNDSGRTVVFVSHDLGLINELCKKVIWLDKGHLTRYGLKGEVLSSFQSSRNSNSGRMSQYITNLQFRSLDSEHLLVSGKPAEVIITLGSFDDMEVREVNVEVCDMLGRVKLKLSNRLLYLPIELRSHSKVCYSLNYLPLFEGNYLVRAELYSLSGEVSNSQVVITIDVLNSPDHLIPSSMPESFVEYKSSIVNE